MRSTCGTSTPTNRSSGARPPAASNFGVRRCWCSPQLTRCPASAAHRYRGQRQTKFVIRSAFGGANEAFVVSGSEDSQVYVWHRHNARLLEVLPGHSGTVNAVAWNPRDPHMFASASDDHTVRIWGVSK